VLPNQVVSTFTGELRELWHAAGRPSYRELARRTHYGRSTLHEALQGTRLPSSDVTSRLVAALGGDAQRWHAGWVAASRSLDGPPAAPGHVRPAQLPPDLADFVGRGTEADRVAGLLGATGPAPPVVVLSGRPGVGKSALARHVAHRVRGDYPDGQLYAALRGPTGEPRKPAEVAGALLRALGLAADAVPATADERSALYRSLLDGRRVLVLLDDAADAAQVRPLLPGEPGCAVLVTSRERPVGLAGATALDIEVFDVEQAVRLLATVAGPERVLAAPADAEAVVRYCGLLPLAVRIAASRLAARPHWPVARLVEQLRDEHARLDALSVADLQVRASVALSERALDETHRTALYLLATLDVPEFAPWLAAAALGRPIADATELVERLVEARLVDVAGPERYRFHDLIRVYARERAAGLAEQPRREALARAAGALLTFAARAALPLFITEFGAEPDPVPYWPDGDWADGLGADLAAWWDAEAQSVLGVLRQAVDARLLPLAGELLRRLAPYLDTAAADEDAAAAAADQQRCEVADAVFLATRDGGAPTVATGALLELAEASPPPGAGRYTAPGLAGDSAAGLAGAEVRLARSLAHFYRASGDPAAALDTATLGLHRAEELGDAVGEADATADLGLALSLLGRHDEAVPMLRRALDLHRALGLPARVARSRRRLGDAERTARYGVGQQSL